MKIVSAPSENNDAWRVRTKGIVITVNPIVSRLSFKGRSSGPSP
jgi:hypothetical protein